MNKTDNKIIAYHGTGNPNFTQFKQQTTPTWFTPEYDLAHQFIKGRRKDLKTSGIVLKAEITLSNPLNLRNVEVYERMTLREFAAILVKVDSDTFIKTVRAHAEKTIFFQEHTDKNYTISECGTYFGPPGVNQEKFNNQPRQLYSFLDLEPIIQTLKDMGFDGIIATETQKQTYAVFGLEQIKTIEYEITPELSMKAMERLENIKKYKNYEPEIKKKITPEKKYKQYAKAYLDDHPGKNITSKIDIEIAAKMFIDGYRPLNVRSALSDASPIAVMRDEHYGKEIAVTAIALPEVKQALNSKGYER